MESNKKENDKSQHQFQFVLTTVTKQTLRKHSFPITYRMIAVVKHRIFDDKHKFRWVSHEFHVLNFFRDENVVVFSSTSLLSLLRNKLETTVSTDTSFTCFPLNREVLSSASLATQSVGSVTVEGLRSLSKTISQIMSSVLSVIMKRKFRDLKNEAESQTKKQKNNYADLQLQMSSTTRIKFTENSLNHIKIRNLWSEIMC
jgi:hypothetical protein